MMYQSQIVHIPDVVPDAKPLLDVVVKIVQHRKLDKLRYLTAQADPSVSAKAVYNTAYIFCRPFIAYPLPRLSRL